jgi:hypothetical protein
LLNLDAQVAIGINGALAGSSQHQAVRFRGGQSLQLGGRFDELARHLLQARHHVSLGRRPFHNRQSKLFGAGLAIALEVVGLDRIGIGRERQIVVRVFAPVGVESLFKSG